MNTEQYIRDRLKSTDYDFLRTDKYLGSNIIMLTVGGSYAYGTNTPNSDLDIRGCATCTRDAILCCEDFKHVNYRETDTYIYSLKEFLFKLAGGEPTALMMLGNRPEYYFYVSEFGQLLLDNTRLFLSKRVIERFMGYIRGQLHGIDPKVVNMVGKYHTTYARDYVCKCMTRVVHAYMVLIDILEKQQIVTYRNDNERALLNALRNGGYLDADITPNDAFNALCKELQEHFEHANETTALPSDVNCELLYDLLMRINEQIVCGVK